MTAGRCHDLAGRATEEIVRTEDDVRRFVDACCLPDTEVATVGVETEWLVVDRADPLRPIPPARSRAVLGDGPLPDGSRITYEPGGQLELSSPPRPLAVSVAAVADDLAVARRALADDGLQLVGLGVDPVRPPRRMLGEPRYDAMDAFFGAAPPLGADGRGKPAAGASPGGAAGEFPGPVAGTVMMCSTASVQVNLDLGTGPTKADRWRLAHDLGPVLVAIFASSPMIRGRLTGWRSSRQAVWAAIDSTRTRSAATLAADPVEAYAALLLGARVMLVRDKTDGGPGTHGRCTPVLDGTTFADWLAGGGPVPRPPTQADLAYHVTTLFPPVRARGWLELRYLDAQPSGTWPVAVAVAVALLDDPRAADAAADACSAVAGRWATAARCGLDDPDLARAARTCLRLALDALPRFGVEAPLIAAVEAFAEDCTDARRCPADAVRSRVAATGALRLLEDLGEVPLCTPRP